MKKLEDYKGQKIAIHFPTYELWLRRREINPSDDLKDEQWNINKEHTCYFVDFNKAGERGCIDWAKQNLYTILPATDFLEEEFVYGQEYEFSNDNKKWHKKIYLCKTPNNRFIAWNKDNELYATWDYARKINTERTEAINTIKELVSKFSINQNEFF